MGEMASLMSHELNQPLAAIASYATGSLNILQEATVTDPQLANSLHDAMQRIGQQAERAGKVIKSVHDFVRRRDQSRVEVAPRTLLDNVMPLVALQARKLGVRVEVRTYPDAGHGFIYDGSPARRPTAARAYRAMYRFLVEAGLKGPRARAPMLDEVRFRSAE